MNDDHDVRIEYMARPKFFRDPVHLQIRFEAVSLDEAPNNLPPDKELSWIIRSLIDTRSFQRLRQIRQNGMANFVFHGMEHSRFAHSMGVSHLARVMFSSIVRNMSLPPQVQWQLDVGVASLIHDIGHGPFSHTFEHVLGDIGKKFDHEHMTARFISEDASEINKILRTLDPQLPGRLVPFFDKKKRISDHWGYKIVSSQMDADRLDYVIRDPKFAGLKGHGFDLERIFDLIGLHEENCIAVDRGAIEAVEAYLVTIDQLYRAIYYHKAVRAVSQMFSSAFRRAVSLYLDGDRSIFPDVNGRQHPMSDLVNEGQNISLESYNSLSDSTVWFLLDAWAEHKDKTLSFISSSILRRELFKTVSFDSNSASKILDSVGRAKEIASMVYQGYPGAAEYFVILDEQSRTSYKGYDFGRDAYDESIWLTGEGKPDRPLEAVDESAIISGLRQARYFPRLVLPKKVKDAFTES